MNPILLTPYDISIAASLIILDAALSIWLKIRLHRQIAIAATKVAKPTLTNPMTRFE
jgi:putative ABC transport system permease protein